MARKKNTPSIEADALFDPAKLAEDAVRSNLDPAVFDQIDEGDVVWPRNWFEWAHGSRFLNITPFAKQVEICTNLYAQFCPRCSDETLQATDEHWGHRLLLLPTDMSVGDIQDRVTFLDHGQCAQCNATKPELIELGELNYYQNLAGVAGMRGSKSVTVGGLIGTYQLVRFLSLASPSKYFGLMANQMLHGTFTAITATQCYDTLWQAFKDRVDNAPWFNRYHEFLKREAARLGKDELYDVKDTYLWYGHKQLSFSFCGPDIRTIRGRTRIMCVTGDTLLSTADGLVPIGELAGDRPAGFSPMELLVDAENGQRRATQFYRTAPVPLLRIETHRGYSVTGTPEHPVRVLNSDGSRGYKVLGEIEPGDVVVLKREASFGHEYQRLDTGGDAVMGGYRRYRMPETLDEDLAWLFGVIVAEGSVSWKNVQKGWVKFVSGDREVIDKAVDVFRRKFGHAPKPVWGDRKHTYWRLACQSSRVARFFIDAGVCGHADTKTVPSCVLQSPRSVVAAFIRGYMDGDGHSDDLHLAVHSRSGELLRRVHILLLGFGITSYLKRYERAFGPNSKPANCTRTYWVLKVFGTQLVRYHEEIGFTIPRKQLVKTNALDYERVDGLDITEVFARNVSHGRYATTADGTTVRMNTVDFQRFVKRPTIKRLEKLELGKLRILGLDDLADNLEDVRNRRDLFYDRVVRVEDAAPEETFDITVPDGRNFVANGILNHNSGIDEAGWFDVKGEGSSGGGASIRLNAEETHQALLKSLRTIRSAAMRLRQNGVLDPPDALNADVSSPSSINDFIMRKLRESTENRSVCTFHYSTWEMNPNVPLESLRDEMRNPPGFERDYAAVPPLGANQFINAISAVEKCEGATPQTRLVTWQQKQLVDEFDDTTSYLDVRANARDKVRPRLLAIDTGLTNNSFAIMMMSWDRDARVPVVDAALECMPQQSDGTVMPVNFPMMYENVIERLMQHFWICLVVYDRWQSVDHVQRIRKEHKIESVQYSLKWPDFQVIRARVLDSSLRLPKLEIPIADVRKDDRPFRQIVSSNPVTHLALQILTVREGGRKVIKPLDGTDDLFRCLCLGITFILNPKYTPRFERYGSQMVGGRRVNAIIRTNRELGERREQVPSGVGVRKAFSTGRLT